MAEMPQAVRGFGVTLTTMFRRSSPSSIRRTSNRPNRASTVDTS